MDDLPVPAWLPGNLTAHVPLASRISTLTQYELAKIFEQAGPVLARVCFRLGDNPHPSGVPNDRLMFLSLRVLDLLELAPLMELWNPVWSHISVAYITAPLGMATRTRAVVQEMLHSTFKVKLDEELDLRLAFYGVRMNKQGLIYTAASFEGMMPFVSLLPSLQQPIFDPPAAPPSSMVFIDPEFHCLMHFSQYVWDNRGQDRRAVIHALRSRVWARFRAEQGWLPPCILEMTLQLDAMSADDL